MSSAAPEQGWGWATCRKARRVFLHLAACLSSLLLLMEAMQRQWMGFGCSAPVLLSVGRKISGNFKSMLNASSDRKSVSNCPEDLHVATALPQAFPTAPTARLCSLKDPSKSLLQSHDCFQSPYAPSSQHETPMTLLKNKTSTVALRSNPRKTNKPLHSSNHRPLSGKKAGYGHKGRDHTAVAAKKDSSFQHRKVSYRHK